MAGLIVHEWVEQSGGSELVVDEFVRTFPGSDLFVLWDDAPGRFGVRPQESWLAATPLRGRKALALPLMPSTWRAMPQKREYDWLLVSSHLFAHHARLGGRNSVPKLVYAHTPARYIWEPDLDRRGASPLARAAATVLKPLDRRRSAEAEAVVANSEFTRQRIQRTWRRDAEVIYPPVMTEKIAGTANWADELSASEESVLSALPETFLLGASRFVEYKNLDLVIQAGEWAGLPVVLAGSGPDETRLRQLAAASSCEVSFVTSPGDALLRAMYQRAHAYVFPPIEDFGIMPVEAMAAGAPVIARSIGGAAESLRETGGGVAVDKWNAEEIRAAVQKVTVMDREALRARTHAFSAGRFRREIADWVQRSCG